jgi:hypothetical protein
MNGSKRDSHRRQLPHRLGEARREKPANPGHNADRFSIVPLLLGSRDISGATHRALLENRLRDAATLLMREHGLSCTEAGDLLNVPLC